MESTPPPPALRQNSPALSLVPLPPPALRKNSPASPVQQKTRRPVSFYENWNSDIRFEGRPGRANLKRSLTFHDSSAGRTPSLVFTMSTTVPLSLKTCLNPERHVPTRSSLRHSRMIVLKQSCTVPHKYLPPIIRYHRMAKKLVVLQLGLGLIITCISIWLVIFCSTLYTRDTPYWSGVPLLLAGISSFILLFCCRKEYPGMHLNCYQFIFKIFSISLSLLASVLCFCASLFAIFHLTFLCYSTCNADSVSSCQCNAENTPDTIVEFLMKINIKTFHYVQSCSDVRSKLSTALLASSLLNAAGGTSLFYYVYLHWKSRYLYVYSHVNTVITTPAVITNKK